MSRIAVVGALVAFGAFGLAASMFITGDAATERLGLLFALLGTIVAGLLALLRADQAAKQTDATSRIASSLDGALEPRIRRAVRAVRDEPSDSTTADDSVQPPDAYDPTTGAPLL